MGYYCIAIQLISNVVEPTENGMHALGYYSTSTCTGPERHRQSVHVIAEIEKPRMIL